VLLIIVLDQSVVRPIVVLIHVRATSVAADHARK
jgi:hypothetical protein